MLSQRPALVRLSVAKLLAQLQAVWMSASVGKTKSDDGEVPSEIQGFHR